MITTGYELFLTMGNLEAPKPIALQNLVILQFNSEYESKPESQSLKSTNPNPNPNLNLVY